MDSVVNAVYLSSLIGNTLYQGRHRVPDRGVSGL